MSLPTNILQTVQTYQKAELAWMMNSFCGIHLANKKFNKFNDLTANLGDSVAFDLPPRSITYSGLVITNQQSVQRTQTLKCTQSANNSAAYSDQQFIFNVRDYMDRFGKGAILELGTAIEADILQSITGTMRVNDPQNANFGSLVQTDSGAYRFYGDGVTPINSYGALAQALANFRDFGASPLNTRCILPMTIVPSIVNSGLNQFVMNRNNESAMSWMLGKFSNCEFYESNLLPIHTSGTVGDTAAPNNILTVVSTNDPTGANITQITFSGAGTSDANAIKAGDMLQFNDGVSGKTNLRFRTFIGHQVTAQPVQFRATADAASDGSGNVTISFYPAMVSQQNLNQNINTNIVAGMKATPLPSHRVGVIWSGDQFYLAMPKLPDQDPFKTSSEMDKESGASIRHYFGSQFGQNVRSYVRDSIWGATMVADNSMRLVFPL